MKSFRELNEANSTSIEWEGKELRTTEDPYIKGGTYRAHAVDEDNDEYEIEWIITNDETIDKAQACDWNNPHKVTHI